MNLGNKEQNRQINNFIGMLFGYEKCVFCKDRDNWKPWMENISLRTSTDGKVKRNGYKPPVCLECLSSKKVEDVLHDINADISEYNNYCRGFGAEPIFSDAEREQIMNQVTQAKNKIAGVSGGTVNSD